jgi:cytochrome c553
MKKQGWMLIVTVAMLSAVVQSQQPPAGTATPLPPPTPREPSWAFQVIEKQLPAEDATPKTVPGSTKQYTPGQIDDLFNPPDWFPDEHPAPPAPVVKGQGDAMACGACHLMNGEGHPESAGFAGLPADYIVQQMADFRSGARKDFAMRMDRISKALTEEQTRQIAQWFAALKPQKWTKVQEAAMVPRTMVGQGRMRFLQPGGGMEPIGKRIIVVPEDQERARHRDPHSGFIAYVPPGSLAKGKALVEKGGGGKTIACSICHGDNLKGLANIPRIAGLHPIYIARQLYLFKEGGRAGTDAPLMKKPVAQLTDDDIVNISAYVGSLSPQ